MAAIIAILEGKELELRSRGVHDWADREPWEADSENGSRSSVVPVTNVL